MKSARTGERVFPRQPRLLDLVLLDLMLPQRVASMFLPRCENAVFRRRYYPDGEGCRRGPGSRPDQGADDYPLSHLRFPSCCAHPLAPRAHGPDSQAPARGSRNSLITRKVSRGTQS
jgi:hypothetical protein